jgi:hypothetical protein
MTQIKNWHDAKSKLGGIPFVPLMSFPLEMNKNPFRNCYPRFHVFVKETVRK